MSKYILQIELEDRLPFDLPFWEVSDVEGKIFFPWNPMETQKFAYLLNTKG